MSTWLVLSCQECPRQAIIAEKADVVGELDLQVGKAGIACIWGEEKVAVKSTAWRKSEDQKKVWKKRGKKMFRAEFSIVHELEIIAQMYVLERKKWEMLRILIQYFCQSLPNVGTCCMLKKKKQQQQTIWSVKLELLYGTKNVAVCYSEGMFIQYLLAV